jgi:two-component system phosphate regulon response regulator OmpR
MTNLQTPTENTPTPANNAPKAKILVVDDDLRLRELLRRYLTEQGFHVVGAENAQTMNKLWMRERYDMLVLDLMLPGEDGLAICRRCAVQATKRLSSC